MIGRTYSLLVGVGGLSALIGFTLFGLAESGLVAGPPAGAVPVTHLDNGQRIFLTGMTVDGRVIRNSHGMEGVGCAMCHGQDGRGGMIHGIPAPNITFSFLTDPRGFRSPMGRVRPAYNEESVKAAIVAGLDAGGNELHPEMPRWTGLTAKDLEDLVGFLKTLGAAERRAPPPSQGL